MSYSDFKTLEQTLLQFELRFMESRDLFHQVEPIAPSPLLQQTIAEQLILAEAISTEKARSELIVTPVLMEVYRMFSGKIGYFSGSTFVADPSQGLSGECDFILSANPSQSVIAAPVVTVVEAKDASIKSGLGQCAAQMIGARMFNQRRGISPCPDILGVVTTGVLWKFMRLIDEGLELDLMEYHIDRVSKILGVLSKPFRSPNSQ